MFRNFLYSLASLLVWCDRKACFNDSISGDVLDDWVSIHSKIHKYFIATYKICCHVEEPED